MIEESKLYKVTASYKKSTYQKEEWVNKLSTGKHVTYYITTYFRWGDFEVELTDNEKKNILENDDTVIMNNYSASVNELWDGVSHHEEIKDEEKYTSDEMKEIKKLLFYSKEDDEYRDEDYGIDIDLLEENGWDLDDTEYGINGGCELTEL